MDSAAAVIGRRRRRGAAAAVALVVILWIVAIVVVVVFLFGHGMTVWADGYVEDEALLRRRRLHGARLSLWFAAVAVAGPMLAGLVALAGRLVRTGWAFLALAAVLAIFLYGSALGAYRDLQPPDSPGPPPPPPAFNCADPSDFERCPGG